jgi:SAM-dependent methyltransferase
MILCPGCGAAHANGDFHCPACGYRPQVVDGVPLLAPALADDVEGFDPAAFAMLAAAEDGHFWFESRNRLILRTLRRWFPAARDYLEVGCGTGCVLSAIDRANPGLSLTGTEVLAAGLVHAARRSPRSRLLQVDARALPFTEAFDVIGAFDVLEHIVEDEAVLAQFHRALRPGGGVLLSVPQHPALWSSQDDLARHVRRYRRGELESRLRAAGFEVEWSSSFMAPLLPLLWLARRRRVSDAEPMAQAHQELAPSPPVNAVLGGVLALERALIAAGLRLPAGSSRMVVARRPGAPR